MVSFVLYSMALRKGLCGGKQMWGEYGVCGGKRDVVVPSCGTMLVVRVVLGVKVRVCKEEVYIQEDLGEPVMGRIFLRLPVFNTLFEFAICHGLNGNCDTHLELIT